MPNPAMKRSGDLRLYRRLLEQARPYWVHIAALLLISLFASPLALLRPLPLKIAVDHVLGEHPLPWWLDRMLPRWVASEASALLIAVVAMVIGIALLTQVQSVAATWLRTYVGERLVRDFRGRIFRNLQRMSLLYHDVKGTMDSIYRVQYDSAAIQYIAIDGVIPFVTALLTFASMLAVSFSIDWQLAIVALGVSPFLFAVARAYRTTLREGYQRSKELESAAYSVVQEVLGALRVVKAFGGEDREHDRFLTRSERSVQAMLRLSLNEGLLGMMLGLTTAVGTAAAIYIGVRHVQSGVLTLGSLLLMMGYLSQLYEPLRTISRRIASVQSHLAGAQRAFDIVDSDPDVPEREHALPIGRAEGAITFEHVSFAYGDYPVLDDVSFSVPAGCRVGIAGRTGAGKTTLVSLLPRFFDPSHGRILLDGHDLAEYRLADLRNQFSIVMQEPVLFSTTLGENIAYGRPDATAEDVAEAARAANVATFIEGLPDGYDTMVGERGLTMSGGERQRIALARAFLKNAPLLIMDEPTSSIDIETEGLIFEAMIRLMKGRTTFMIAHRLTTLESCDLLLVLEAGRLVAIESEVKAAIGRALAEGSLVDTAARNRTLPYRVKSR
jgi:ATP-binding cassette subfamily B protein